MRAFGGTLAAVALIGAASPELPERKPGEGVLCMGSFIYFAQIQAKSCHAGKDPEYQKQLDGYVERFDAYLAKNFPGGTTDLAKFKEGQRLTTDLRPKICEYGDDYKIYEGWRDTPAEKLDASVDKILARDGKPTFGDCV